ncbi:HD domain-containing protein [Serpentinicella alkaliphila]|uniref:Ppx/GppA phosphatase n=1 Tax=Serpentinicella alkaliphila TaxID=1734049 RepID=A0A4R2TLV1_9FIRM|nr:HD domain-containing protein [Serpentinicella alkaliphila]QUH25799.1 HD domain-containing protein [Serpentinicella alkaliphila]TCP95842.1 Ppx/GppA phosphatase [Serpentinicella alkaliphila]
MNKSKKPLTIAGISVGSHALKIKIVEVTEKQEIITLEKVSKKTSLGRDTFSKGKVSYEVVDEVCQILKGFKRLMNTYKVQTYQAFATTGIREAENRDYILDQIKSKTGLNVELINSSLKRFLTYKAVREKLPNYQQRRSEGSMFLDIGSGSIELSIYSNGNLTFSQDLKLGSLRLKELLVSLEDKTLNFPKVLEDYIRSNTDILWKTFDFHGPIKHFVLVGDIIKDICSICNCTDYLIDKTRFLTIYQELLKNPHHKAIYRHNISQEGAYILLPTMMLTKIFLDTTSSAKIYTPLVSLEDGIVSNIIDEKFNTNRKQEFLQDTYSLVKTIAEKYRCDQNHAHEVEKKSLILFDALKKFHGLGDQERLLLSLAAVLHDIGKFINMNKHYKHSYDIIIASNIMGISQQQLEIIANIAKYHSDLTPTMAHKNFNQLSFQDRVVVAKLVSIIRIADALDRSHQQKIKDIRVKFQEKKMIIKAIAKADTLLEEWTFHNKSFFFEEVFGITPILSIEREA